MSKLNLIDWDILNRVYYCLFNRLDNYRVIATNENERLSKITITDESGNQIFSIDKNLKVESYNQQPENIINCFNENGIHAS